ncbi:hypothetical protein DFQ28_007737, partial [Apophysomyces sp. BC1034]
TVIDIKNEYEVTNLIIPSPPTDIRFKDDSNPNSQEETDVISYVDQFGPRFEDQCLEELKNIRHTANIKTGRRIEDMLNAPIPKKRKTL